MQARSAESVNGFRSKEPTGKNLESVKLTTLVPESILEEDTVNKTKGDLSYGYTA